MLEDKKHIECIEPIYATGRSLPAGSNIPYSWIPESQLPQLIADGIIRVVKTTLQKKEVETVEHITSITPVLPDIEAMNLAEAQATASEIESLEILRRLRIVEEQNKKRKGVFTAIDRKIRELENL